MHKTESQRRRDWIMSQPLEELLAWQERAGSSRPEDAYAQYRCAQGIAPPVKLGHSEMRCRGCLRVIAGWQQCKCGTPNPNLGIRHG